MIEGQFQKIITPETIGTLGDHLGLVIEPFDATEGDFPFCPKPVQQEPPVITEHFGYFLHGLQPGPHSAFAPVVQELACPARDGILPEPLEVLLQDIRPYGLQVAAQQIDKFIDLLVGEVGGTLQQAPAAMGQHRFFPLFFKAFSFLCTDFINGLAHVGGNMKTVKDVNRLSRSCGNNFQIRPPHVATDKTQPLAAVFSQPVKKTVHGSDGSFFSQPQQTLASLVDLVDHGDKLHSLFLLPGNLVNANRADAIQVPVGKAPFHRHPHRADNRVPAGMKRLRGILPSQSLCPSRKKPGIAGRKMAFALRPRKAFDLDATPGAIPTPWRIDKEHLDIPHRNKLKSPDGQRIITGTFFAASGTDQPVACPWTQSDFNCRPSIMDGPSDSVIDKSLLLFDPIQYRLDLHPVFLVPDDENFVDSLHQNRRRDALFPGFQNETKIYYGASGSNPALFRAKHAFMH